MLLLEYAHEASSVPVGVCMEQLIINGMLGIAFVEVL